MSQVTSLAAVARRKELIHGGLTPIPARAWVQGHDSPKVLTHLCHERYLLAKSSMVWIEKPYLREAALKLMDHVTRLFPGENGSLVDNAIEEAVNAYYAGLRSPKRTEPLDRFIRTFAKQADHIIGYQVVAISDRPGRVHAWQTWDESLPDWLERGGFNEFFMRQRQVVTDMDKARARLALATLLFPQEALDLVEFDSCSSCGSLR